MCLLETILTAILILAIFVSHYGALLLWILSFLFIKLMLLLVLSLFDTNSHCSYKRIKPTSNLKGTACVCVEYAMLEINKDAT